MTAFPSFRPQALQFLKRLARNNTKEWFQLNRSTYEQEVLGPFRELVEEMDVQFARFAPEIVGHPKRSIFRIYRDVRFSSDKSPYKTNAAAWFYHRDASKSVGSGGGGAGFYFQIEPNNSFLGGGVWMPPRESLARIRDGIVRDHRSFERIVTAPSVKRRFGSLTEEGMLKRMPRGFAEDAPGARWLRYQSFTVGRKLSDDDVLRLDLPKLLVRDYTAILPLVRWLNNALGYAPAERR